METQGIIIWARSGSGALILWCADNGALVYVAERREVGDRHEALTVGDFVDLRVETVGAMRVGRDLRYRGTGAEWIRKELGREVAGVSGPATSPDGKIARMMNFGAEAAGSFVPLPANCPAWTGPGAA